MPIYHHYWGETTYFALFPEAVIGRCSRKYLWEEQHFYWKNYFKKAVKIIEGFPAFLKNGLCFTTNFVDIFWNVHLFVKQYINFKKQSVGSTVKVLAISLKTVFNEDDFIANLFYQISIKNRKMTWNIS